MQIYSVDTNSFLTESEQALYKKIKGMEGSINRLKEFTLLNIIEDIYNERITFEIDKAYKEGILIEDVEKIKLLLKIRDNNTDVKENKKTKSVTKAFDKPKYSFKDEMDLEEQLQENSNKTYIKKYINSLMDKNKSLLKDKAFKKLMVEVDENYIKYEAVKIIDKKGKSRTVAKNIGYNNDIKIWKKELNEEIRKNSKVRLLNRVNKYNIISVFNSALTRTLGLEASKLSEDLISLRVYHYPIFKQLLDNGFMYNGGKYISFTSSAGQIRNKKMIFIKEVVWDKFHDALMCGVTVEKINNSKEKGCNINKFLAYLALQASSTEEWKINIDNCIVIDDFETTIKNAEVNYIAKTRESRDIKVKDSEGDYIKNEDGTYKIIKEEYWLLSDKAEKCEKDITITHSDGCGWVLPEISKTNFQFRMPWFKGLLTPVDFISYCKEHNNNSFKVLDIYNKEWDLLKDEIKIVFFKSQFKMYKYYDSWEQYKENFKKYNCQAGKCNLETGEFNSAKFNYQMWQTLEKIDDILIEKFTSPVDKLITDAYKDKDMMLKLLGASDKNQNMNYLQQALMIYPELIKDEYIKKELSEAISKKRKESKYGRFKLNSAVNTFIIPDIFAWMEYSLKRNKNPIGLLKDKEVYCKLFSKRSYPELLVNRSPHLGKEHCVRNNINGKAIEKWFISDGIYTSCHDLISKILQFDNDGDKSLVVGDSDIIQACKENMKDEKGEEIRPLYYKMGKAEAKQINSENIYNSLITAFEYGNIGEYSNKLTKLWNYRKHNSEGIEVDFTEEEIKERLNLSEIITCCNNFSIDAAKTLEMVEVSSEIGKRINEINKVKMPYFYKFAKDCNNVEDINESTVNKICSKIQDISQGDYCYTDIGEFSKRMLINNIRVKIDERVIAKYKLLNKEMQKYFMYISNVNEDEEQSKERIASLVYDSMFLEFEAFCKTKNIDIVDAVDVILKHIYSSNKDCKKAFLFNVFGDIIVTNLKKNIKKKIKQPKEGYIFCKDCGKEVKKTSNRQVRCTECSKKKIKEKDRNRRTNVK